MRWGHPEYLWFLLLVPLWFGVAWLRETQRKDALSRLIRAHLQPEVIRGFLPGGRLRRAIAWSFGIACIILASAGPQWGRTEETVQVTGLDVLVALDVSNSMETEDVVPSRIQKSKRFVRMLAERLPGDRMGLVAFAGTSYLASPLTTDLDYLAQVLDGVSPRTISSQGTNIGRAVSMALDAIERGAQEGVDPAVQQDPTQSMPSSKVLVLISDGEDFEGEVDVAIARLKKSQIRLFVFGVGTETGGQIPVRDEDGNLRGYRRDSGGANVVSKFSSKALESLADSGRGKFWTLTDQGAEVDAVVKELAGMDRTGTAERKFYVYKERFQIPLVLGILIFLLELTLSLRSGRGVVAALVLGVWATGCESRDNSPVTVYENSKGIDALKSEKLDEAVDRFGSAQAQNPDAPELFYNLGVAQAARGAGPEAEREFKKGVEAFEKRGQKEELARSLYNLGAVLEKENQLPRAIDQFARAAQAAKEGGATQVEREARERVLKLAQQMQQQKKDGDGGQGGKGDPKKPDEGKDPKDEGDGKQPKQYSRGEFKSKQMSKSAAEEVMNALAEKEKGLQEKLRKKNTKGSKSDPSGKDW